MALTRKETRGVPPPLTFDLFTLPDSTQLTQKEVAAAKRQSVAWIEKRRYDGSDKLEWLYVNGLPRCIAGSLKKAMAGDDSVRRPSVAEHLEAKNAKRRKTTAAPSPRRAVANVMA